MDDVLEKQGWQVPFHGDGAVGLVGGEMGHRGYSYLLCFNLEGLSAKVFGSSPLFGSSQH